MFRQYKTRMILMASFVLLVASGFLKAQVKEPDEYPRLKQTSDSVAAALAKGLLQRDSALLASVVSDELSVVMAGKFSNRGKSEIMKQVPPLFEKVGGWQLTTFRQTLDLVKKMDGLGREAGRFTLREPPGQKAGKMWKGEYLAHWKLRNGKWVLHTLLLSKK